MARRIASSSMFDVYAASRTVESGGVQIVYGDHGSEDGTPVLLIHGFPDSARLWRNQVLPLVESGCRVLTPDLRGYGKSDKPDDAASYKVRILAADMIAVLDDAGIDTAHVVGHDWGAGVAWYLALAHAARVRSLTALSVGHPAAFRRAGIRQLEKSWYTLLFQFEDVAEEWLSRNDWQGMRRWLGEVDELDNWIADLSRPGALTAALGPYRANLGPERLIAPPAHLPPIECPVMGVWSDGDVALLESQMEQSGEHVSGEWRYVRLEGVGHWIPLEAPDALNRLLLEWFQGH